MWKIITNVVLGKLGGIFGGYLDYRNVKSRLEADVLTRYMEAEIETNQQKIIMNKLFAERWETRFIVPGFAFITMAHYGAVVLDSIFIFPWNVAALPNPINEWEGQIILSFFIVVPAKDLLSKWLNRGIVSSVITNAKSVFSRKGRQK